MTEKLTKEQLDEFQGIFTNLVKKGDGKIATKEFEQVLRGFSKHSTEAELQGIINMFDLDGSGTIDFKEYVTWMPKIKIKVDPEDEKVKEVFRQFDQDGNGFITANKVRHVLSNMGKSLTQDEADNVIRAADMDGDGVINYEEFVRILQHIYK